MKSLFFSIFLILSTVVGLLINGYILMVIILTKQIKSANHILLFHLGTIDICIGIIFLVFFIPGAHGKEWESAGLPCLFHGFIFTFLQPLALWTICGLNCDRFYIICVPLHYNRIITSKKVLIALGVVWTTSLILSTPPFFEITPFTFTPRLGACQPERSTGSGILWYSIIYTTFSLFLPAFFIIFSNVKIFIIARYHRHRIASAIFQVAISAQVAITHQKNPLSMSLEQIASPPSGPKFHSALYTLLQIVGSFFILYLPYYFVILWEAVVDSFYNSDGNKALNSIFYTISSSLLLFTVPVNGFLYGVKSKQLRQVFKNYWRKKQTAHDLNQEIQARTPSVCGSRRPSLLINSKNMLADVNKILKSPLKGQNNSNTLQVPSSYNQEVSLVTEDEIYRKLQSNSSGSRYRFLHSIFGGSKKNHNVSNMYIPLKSTFQNAREKKSPTILLTKASSEKSVSSTDSDIKICEPLLDKDNQSNCVKMKKRKCHILESSTFKPLTTDVTSFNEETSNRPQTSTYQD
ncbi:trace amine-associated receptor 3-like isoform X1 [Diorhabda sublineata]|uniref:trace amine-associated receptor 3-like isoform X1 n=1 Tax=Diorhabda sublineata TaxID=1163346 RepID=UPI0024E17AF9|nr:trace amine-associated receptor 3-like isoform X1 [Diorhabda sublineata]XP_056640326.1 trace amine-associated receptor 3-like isoform X1 [Diorhabda sublineata]XP_056640327.1 trace amine-associated receptor 3-like isoform X1 [Diorhabda sublineata]